MTRHQLIKALHYGLECNGETCNKDVACIECIIDRVDHYEYLIREEYFNEIKEGIDNLYKYYLDGTTCSTSESIIGAKVCKDILSMIEDLKKGGGD